MKIHQKEIHERIHYYYMVKGLCLPVLTQDLYRLNLES